MIEVIETGPAHIVGRCRLCKSAILVTAASNGGLRGCGRSSADRYRWPRSGFRFYPLTAFRFADRRQATYGWVALPMIGVNSLTRQRLLTEYGGGPVQPFSRHRSLSLGPPLTERSRRPFFASDGGCATEFPRKRSCNVRYRTDPWTAHA
jgi:hypothetical protein